MILLLFKIYFKILTHLQNMEANTWKLQKNN